MVTSNPKINVGSYAKIYGEFFENITEDKIESLNILCAKDMFFRDPFNSFTGLDKFKKVFQHMYKQASNPKFFISDICTINNTAYMKWNFSSGKFVEIEGISEIKFNEDGLVTSHVDYWDSASQIFAKIPIIKYLIRYLIKKLSI
ncbi:MAG: hypothetical protein CFH01_00257 [Alphaproteobacteria bacterium MarineAlpha2_Bin1]|nr:MAG: hypothetical protein CFH01_00257 [Alphaproteobacteria bacterium MarineAlpha2_Bin1]